MKSTFNKFENCSLNTVEANHVQGGGQLGGLIGGIINFFVGDLFGTAPKPKPRPAQPRTGGYAQPQPYIQIPPQAMRPQPQIPPYQGQGSSQRSSYQQGTGRVQQVVGQQSMRRRQG